MNHKHDFHHYSSVNTKKKTFSFFFYPVFVIPRFLSIYTMGHIFIYYVFLNNFPDLLFTNSYIFSTTCFYFYLGLPFLYKEHDIKRRSTTDEHLYDLYDDWNITSVPRSIHPHLVVKGHHHILPPKALEHHVIGIEDTEDDRLLRRFHEIKVSVYYEFVLPQYLLCLICKFICFSDISYVDCIAFR